MTSQNNTNNPHELYYLDKDMRIRSGQLHSYDGPDAFVVNTRRTEHGISSDLRRLPRDDVFTTADIGQLALDLMPLEPGGTRSFNNLLKRVLSDPEKTEDLSMRLLSTSFERRLITNRPDSHYGFLPPEEIIGDPEVAGSNLWKVRELVSGMENGKYPKGTANELRLAFTRESELAMLPPEEAESIKDKINTANTRALRIIFDLQGVDYDNSFVWERYLPEGVRETRTVYPFHDGACSFVESTYFSVDTREPMGGAPGNVTVMIGIPDFSAENEFLPAI